MPSLLVTLDAYKAHLWCFLQGSHGGISAASFPVVCKGQAAPEEQGNYFLQEDCL